MRRVNCIMLVDDDLATNFLHKKLISDLGLAEKIVVTKDCKEALDYLTSSENPNYVRPDLIFLDINMPIMDGWEFLDYYEKLPASSKANVLMVMLTTSLNPDDKEKTSKKDVVHTFLSKPLTPEMLKEIMEEKLK